VLVARLAGDDERPTPVRALAAAAAAPLGLGLYASFSRGALFAGVAGLIVIVPLARRREQLAGWLVVVLAAVVAAAVVSPLHGVTSLDGSLSHREHQGLIALVVLVVCAALAAAVQSWLAGAHRVRGPLSLPRHTGLAAAGLVVLGLAAAIVAGAHETGGEAKLSGGASRLVSLESNRYDYWHVALRAFVQHPFHGVGAGNWVVEWLRWRTIPEYAVDAHSLPLQVLAELGIVGALALLALFGGVAAAARRALRVASPPVGAVAALVTYLVHAPLDWDWQMPAVTLLAAALAGLVIACAEEARTA
jgi:O-antigen ligase